ncbi:MAG: hypothetical protein AABX70_04890 [Nanoarchaeota archaeon]
MTNKCPNCHVEVHIAERIIEEAVRYQCGSCEYSKLEPAASRTATPPILTSPLQLKQKITTLSQGRLGLYLNQDVVRSLGLKAGQEVFVSVPDSKTVVIKLVL